MALRGEPGVTCAYHRTMRCLLLVVLMVLLPLRGWTADAMVLSQMPAKATAHALCPDHLPAPGSALADQAGDGEHGSAGKVHAHCTACQLPALSLSQPSKMPAVLPGAPPAATPVALIEPAPRRQIKPPIA